MYAALDIETQGLHAGRFIAGALALENGKTEVFYKKDELWAHILSVAAKEAKRDKRLTIYAHNANYDVFGTAPITEPGFTIVSTNPHISEYRNINFYDSMGLFKMALEGLGELLKLPKGETPEWLKQNAYEPSKEELEEMEVYLRRDVEIIIAAIKMLKKKLGEHSMRPRRLVTRSQIAISYVTKRLKEHKLKRKLFYPGLNSQGIPYIAFGKLLHPKYPELIHEAYRGGRVEAFQTGHFPSVSQIDINSQYPYAATQIRFPDLGTERMIEEPTKNNFPYHVLFKKIGVSSCIIELPTSGTVGLLQVRTNKDNYQPTRGIVVGTWTHSEILQAVLSGHKILHVFESVIWEDLPENPLKNIYSHLYELKRTAEDDFSRQFYKDLLNHSTGKFAQHRQYATRQFGSVEDAEQMKLNGYKPIGAIETNILYERDEPMETKPYYCPIITTLITAYGRIMLWKALKELPTQDIIYTDTDGIIFKDSNRNIERFKYGTELGEWKLEARAVPLLVWNKKTYRIGEKYRISGASARWIEPEDFSKGYIQYARMRPLHRMRTMSDIGSFEHIHRELEREEHHDPEQLLHIDHAFKQRMTPEQLDVILEVVDTNG